jgi:hypothetical protein
MRKWSNVVRNFYRIQSIDSQFVRGAKLVAADLVMAGLSRPSRSIGRCALPIEIAGTSPAMTPPRDSILKR